MPGDMAGGRVLCVAGALDICSAGQYKPNIMRP